ncbi:cysteine-rich receptor-like protein kinase 8 [Triticum aestivum]|uniref:cysteine-rich receptor-like protein kinase 8 n=1 Tax=Triticum aestivum TaxID=4565 RepID=UPI001D030918|nr:cysteine-rich receptor-like protein kinase 8 [Triticum aestivum]
MALQRPPLLLLCFHLLAALHTTSYAALSSHLPQAMDCSTSGNYTSTSAYAANLNKFLASLPEKTIFKNGGFINDTVGEGTGTVYGLAMCSADYSRSDCGDCLAAAASSNANGLPNRCPGSTTVLAWFDPCLVRYSDTNFFGTAQTGEIYTLNGPRAIWEPLQYRNDVVRNLNESIAAAVASSQRFAASSTDPYTLVQCTWDLPPDQCKQCLDVLTANASKDWTSMAVDGKRRSYSCSVRYGNTSFVVVPFGGAPTPQSVDQATTSANQSSSAAGKGSLTAGVVGSVVGLILLACACLIWYRRNAHPNAHKFTYQQLVGATRDFADTRRLGQGAFGVVYKGAVMVQDKEVDVAIKTALVVSDEARAAFKNEVEIMSPLNHSNIIRLVGSCDEEDNLLLVYELVEDRNLQARLYGRGARVDAELTGVRARGSSLDLDWRKRYNILLGITWGLEYLHAKCAKCVLHRDIKPGNVMLDRDSNAKLCDFGLVTQLTHAITSRSTNNIIGTQVYMDPAYRNTGKITKESDVYSFGVLLLEVVCGEEPVLIDGAGKNSLIEKVRECEKRNAILDAADQQLRGEFDEEIKAALSIGLCCVETRRGDRPTIQIVLGRLLSLTGKLASNNRHPNAVCDEV